MWGVLVGLCQSFVNIGVSNEMENLDRVAIIFTSCSGKTTLAHALAEILYMEHIELDTLDGLPDWGIRFFPESRALLSDRIAGSRWVLTEITARFVT